MLGVRASPDARVTQVNPGGARALWRDRKGIEIGLRRFESPAGALHVGDAVTREREAQQRVRMPVARRRRGRDLGRTLELGNCLTELTLGNQRGTEGGAWVRGTRMASPDAMHVQQFEGIAGEPLRLVNPFELKLAEGEIREHVRGRCGVLVCSRQPSRLLEWDACRFRLAEEKARLPHTEERLPPPAAAWAFDLEGVLSR